MTLIELARKLRPYIEKAAVSLSDADALEAVNLFPNWNGNLHHYVENERVVDNNILYKCLLEHTSQSTWAPSVSPSLWTKVLIPDENVIPEWEQPSSTNPYQIGDRVSHNGKIWENTVTNNVWEPGVYGWTEINI